MFNKYLKIQRKVFTGIHSYITMFTLHSLGILYTSSLNVYTSVSHREKYPKSTRRLMHFSKLCMKTSTCLTIFT